MDPDLTRVEAKTDKSAADIVQLTINVNKLALMIEHGEKDRKNDMDQIRDAIKNMTALSEKLNALMGLEKEVNAIKGEIKAVLHSVGNLKNAQLSIPIHAEKISKLEGKVETMETMYERASGAAGVIKFLWGVFGTALLSLGGFLVYLYFKIGAAGSIVTGGDIGYGP